MRLVLVALVLVSCGPTRVSPFAPQLHRVGRFVDSDAKGPRFVWSATRFSLYFTGDYLRLQLKQLERAASVEGDPQPLRVWVEVDGAGDDYYADERGELDVTVPNLRGGEHHLTLVRQSEALVGEAQLLGISVARAGQVRGWDRPPRHRIEFIGDSVTTGFGNDGEDPCKFSSKTQAATKAAPWLVGEALEADVTVVAWAGRGVLRNYDDRKEPTVPQLWRPLVPPPDAVLIALGANDFWRGDPGEGAFVAAYRAFYAKVREAYPRAEIYAVITPTNDLVQLEGLRRYLRQVPARLLEVGPRREDEGSGCIGHPSAKTHRRAADEIVARLRSDLGW
jgi:lysophospholipase L1-like esterase